MQNTTKAPKQITIAVLNQKGGVGKTTLTVNLGFALKNDGHEVIIIDSDPQASATDWGNETGGDIITVVGLGAASLLSGIKAISAGYDFVLIDGAPRLSANLAAAVKAADIVLIPVKPSSLDLWACGSVVDVVKERQELGAELQAFFVVSQAINNTKLATEVKSVLEELNIPALTTQIINRIAYPGSVSDGKTVFHTQDKKAQLEMNNIKEEVLRAIKR